MRNSHTYLAYLYKLLFTCDAHLAWSYGLPIFLVRSFRKCKTHSDCHHLAAGPLARTGAFAAAAPWWERIWALGSWLGWFIALLLISAPGRFPNPPEPVFSEVTILITLSQRIVGRSEGYKTGIYWFLVLFFWYPRLNSGPRAHQAGAYTTEPNPRPQDSFFSTKSGPRNSSLLAFL